jgi:hypothetical protein
MITPHIVIYEKISDENKTKFKEKGIVVIDNFRDTINKSRILHRNSRIDILSFLDGIDKFEPSNFF